MHTFPKTAGSRGEAFLAGYLHKQADYATDSKSDKAFGRPFWQSAVLGPLGGLVGAGAKAHGVPGALQEAAAVQPRANALSRSAQKVQDDIQHAPSSQSQSPKTWMDRDLLLKLRDRQTYNFGKLYSSLGRAQAGLKGGLGMGAAGLAAPFVGEALRKPAADWLAPLFYEGRMRGAGSRADLGQPVKLQKKAERDLAPEVVGALLAGAGQKMHDMTQGNEVASSYPLTYYQVLRYKPTRLDQILSSGGPSPTQVVTNFPEILRRYVVGKTIDRLYAQKPSDAELGKPISKPAKEKTEGKKK